MVQGLCLIFYAMPNLCPLLKLLAMKCCNQTTGCESRLSKYLPKMYITDIIKKHPLKVV